MKSIKLIIIVSIVIVLVGSLTSCEKEVAKKGITKYVITRMLLPDGWVNQFIYSNDTLIEKTEISHNGQLITVDKINRINANSLVLSSYAYPKFSEVQTIRSFKFTNGIISQISIINSSSLNQTFQYDIEFDGQSRLSHYEYYSYSPAITVGGVHYHIEDADVTWLTNGLEAVITPNSSSNIFKVSAEGEIGESVWSKLSLEAMATVIFQDMHLIEYFVPNRIVGIENTSFGFYTYDNFIYDANGNPTSIRRTNLKTNEVDYFKFEWRRVDL